MPKVSIIIPIYNTEKYLSRCLDSIIEQSFQDFECICINDGSTDKSRGICESYVRKDSRVRLINQKNEGVSGARNKGINVAIGDYITFLDSDDWIHSRYLEILYNMCESNHCDIAQCGLQKVSDTSSVHKITYYDTEILDGRSLIIRRFEENGWVNGLVCNKLIKKNIAKQVLFPMGRRHEDEAVSYRYYSLASRVACTSAGLYYYWQHSDSFMHQGFQMASLDVLDVFEQKAAFFKDTDLEIYTYTILSLYATILRYSKQARGNTSIISLLNKKMEALLNEMDIHDISVPQKMASYFTITRNHLAENIQYRHYVYNSSCDRFVEVREPAVTIVIPVYNAESYLNKMLNSVTNQTFSNLEIICVDDGSTDLSLSIIKSYAQMDDRIKILQQKNQFAGVARNNGLDNATGKYIIFLDSDDDLKINMIQELYEKAENTSADIVLCKIIKKNIRLGTLVAAEYSLKTELLNASVFNYEDIPNSIFQLTIPAPFNKFYLKSFLINKKLQFQALHNANDMYMSYAALALADKIAYVDKALYIYQFNAKGNLSSKRKKSPFCFIEALSGLKDKLIEHNRFDILKKSFITLCLGQYVYQLNEMKDVITRYEILKEVLKDPLSVLQYPEECYSKTDKQNRGKLKELEQIINWQYQSLKWEMGTVKYFSQISESRRK